MSETRVTGGTVSYMRRVKTGDYEHAEAKAELSFSVGEADSDQGMAIFDSTSEEAVDRVHAMLRLKTPAPRADKRPEEVVVLPQVARRQAVEAVQTAKLQEALKQEDPLAPAVAQGAPQTSASREGADNEDPLAEDAGSAAPATTSATIVAAGTEDPLADNQQADPFVAEPREITDIDVSNAMSKKNKELVDAHGPAGTQKIKDVLGNYVAPGLRGRDVPQNLRQKFLADLAALK